MSLLLTDTKDQRSIFDVGCHNTTDMKNFLLGVRQRIFGVNQWKPDNIKDASMMSAILSQPTPFKRYKFKL
jgi:hypothetical protein